MNNVNDTHAPAAVVVKPLDPVRLLTAGEPASGFDVDFAPIFGRLYPVVFAALEKAGVVPAGRMIAYYTERTDGTITVVAAVPIPPDASVDSADTEVVSLPSVARAATLMHHGDMATCSTSYQALQTWIEAAGEKAVGYSREIYLNCDGPLDTWVTELQFVLE
jgi:effector-binding domain-containing protein